MNMQRQAVESKFEQLELWQSDQFIVSMKQSNDCGEKGLARMRQERRDTPSGHRAGYKVSTKLLSLTNIAGRNLRERFTSLAHFLNEDFLLECFWELKRKKAPGIDGVKVEEYEVNIRERIKDLVGRLKCKRYRPQPVRRVYIPKSNGERRPLGIPSVEDKVVQMGVKKILEAIYEVDFEEVSYGFRAGRSCHDALNDVDKTIMTKSINYVIDADIEKFFDTVNHNWLMKFLKARIADRNLLEIIGRMLKVGIMEEGKYIEVDKGTPQGGILSPLLANIYLHYALDQWFSRVIKKKVNGYTRLVRYADDFVICCQFQNEAEKIYRELKERMRKFELKISGEKSRIIEFGRNAYYKAERMGERIGTFDFLGFTHYARKSRKGKFILGQKTARTRLNKKTKEVNQWLKEIRNRVKLPEWWAVLGKKLTGHYNYYGVSGNLWNLRKFYSRCFWLAYKWINRRSQKRSMDIGKYQKFIKFNPLPLPVITHRTYTLSYG